MSLISSCCNESSNIGFPYFEESNQQNIDMETTHHHPTPFWQCHQYSNESPIFVIEADQQLTDEAVRFLVSFLRRLPFHRGESLAQHHQGSQNQTAARDWGKCYLHLPRILHRRFWWLADEVW